MPRAVDLLGGLLAVGLGIGVVVATGNIVGKTLGVVGAALLGGLVGLAVITPVVATRRYRCSQCGTEQPQPGKRAISGWLAVALAGAALAGVAGLLLVADSRAHSYPDQVRAAFMTSCEKSGGATSGQCQCAFEALERAYTLQEYAALEAGLARGGDLPQHAVDVMAPCGPQG